MSKLCGTTTTIACLDQVFVPRGAFDDSEGALRVERLSTVESRSCVTEPGLKSSLYLAIGAAGALLMHMEESESIALFSKSLHVQVSGTQK